MDAEPNNPPNREGERESGKAIPPEGESGTVSPPTGRTASAAAYLPLPPFFADVWEPDDYDEVVLEWWGEAYLLECGSIHWWDDGGHHEHGEVLALVVVETWVDECIALATGERSEPPQLPA